MKKYGPLIFFLVALVLAIGAYVVSRNSTLPVAEFRSEIARYPQNREIPEEVYAKYYRSVGPDTMLAIINERAACHLEGHGLGKLIYDDTRNLPQAVYRCLDKCYGGCIHGAMLGFVDEERKSTGVIGDPRAEDLTPGLMQTIVGLCDKSEIKATLGLGSCYHALGHVFAYFTDSDITQTLKLCRTLEEKGAGAVFHCAEGFYMQRSADYGKQDIKKDVSKWYPCDVSDYPAACYRYRIPLKYSSSTPFDAVVRDCAALPEPDRSACIHGLGVSAAFTVQNNPGLINKICTTADPIVKRMCLDGVLGRLSIADPNAGESICSVYTGMSKPECLKSTPSTFDIERDYSTYLVPR